MTNYSPARITNMHAKNTVVPDIRIGHLPERDPRQAEVLNSAAKIVCAGALAGHQSRQDALRTLWRIATESLEIPRAVEVFARRRGIQWALADDVRVEVETRVTSSILGGKVDFDLVANQGSRFLAYVRSLSDGTAQRVWQETAKMRDHRRSIYDSDESTQESAAVLRGAQLQCPDSVPAEPGADGGRPTTTADATDADVDAAEAITYGARPLTRVQAAGRILASTLGIGPVGHASDNSYLNERHERLLTGLVGSLHDGVPPRTVGVTVLAVARGELEDTDLAQAVQVMLDGLPKGTQNVLTEASPMITGALVAAHLAPRPPVPQEAIRQVKETLTSAGGPSSSRPKGWRIAVSQLADEWVTAHSEVPSEYAAGRHVTTARSWDGSRAAKRCYFAATRDFVKRFGETNPLGDTAAAIRTRLNSEFATAVESLDAARVGDGEAA